MKRRDNYFPSTQTDVVKEDVVYVALASSSILPFKKVCALFSVRKRQIEIRISSIFTSNFFYFRFPTHMLGGVERF